MTYYFDGGGSSNFSTEYRRATQVSFQAWKRAWPVLHFIPAKSASGAEIVIKYGRYGRSGFWKDHAGLTVPSVDILGCQLNHALIQINDTYLVHAGRLEYPLPMLEHLIVHEIGHALGLRHVYKAVPSVMVPTPSAYRYTTPQRYDIHTIASLYPMPARERRLLDFREAAGRVHEGGGTFEIQGAMRPRRR